MLHDECVLDAIQHICLEYIWAMYTVNFFIHSNGTYTTKISMLLYIIMSNTVIVAKRKCKIKIYCKVKIDSYLRNWKISQNTVIKPLNLKICILCIHSKRLERWIVTDCFTNMEPSWHKLSLIDIKELCWHRGKIWSTTNHFLVTWRLDWT